MKLIVITVLGLFGGPIFGQNNIKTDRISQVENSLIPFVPVKDFERWNIRDRMKYYGVPGVSIAVIKDYRIDWAKGYGLADTARKIPVTTETMFSAGSISKLLLAVTALKMVERGQLELEKPINNYIMEDLGK